MSKISIQSKSFIVLFLVALFGTFLCLNLSFSLLSRQAQYRVVSYNVRPTAYAQAPIQPPPVPPVDTSSWKTYTNTKYNFSFKYKPGWNVLAASQQAGYTVLQVDPEEDTTILKYT